MSDCCYHRAVAVIFVCISLFVCSSLQANEIRTYQFVDNGEANLRFGGGLISGESFAAPKGTLDITISEDGSATITRFDVDVANVLVESHGVSVFAEGMPLDDYMFGLEPVGLLARFDSPVVFSTRPNAQELIDFGALVNPFIDIYITSLRDRSVSVSFRSHSGFFLDNPSLSTIGSGSRAILLTVPEPGGLALIFSLALLFFWGCRQLPTVRLES